MSAFLDSPTSLRHALVRIATRCVASLRAAEARDTLQSGFVPTCIATAFVASAALLLVIAAPLFEIDPTVIQRAALASFGLPWLVLLARAARAFLRPRSHPVGLALADLQLRLADRLRTAHEFLGAPTRSSFMAAAIADAETHLERAREFVPVVASRSSLRAWQASGWLLLATLCFGSSLLIDARRAAARGAVGRTAQGVLARSVDPVRVEPQAALPREPTVAPPERSAAPAPRMETAANGPAREDSAPPHDEPTKSQGLLSPGQSTAAGSAHGQSDASSAATVDAQKSRAPEFQSAPHPGRPRAGKPRERSTAPRLKNDERSGATAGRGAASGTNRNPAASDWSSRDQVVSLDEPPLENETEVDDDDAESDARGGLQPDLRDRKPPVNRDLAIGFGNEPDPDANGRGGASEQKKSRGVASLVLGVPIPDHIKGKPSPGRTKVTQERIEPAPEDAAAVDAGPRAPRTQPHGYVPHLELLPWMREIVKRYTLSLRHPSVSGE